jgi:hypothetical protein
MLQSMGIARKARPGDVQMRHMAASCSFGPRRNPCDAARPIARRHPFCGMGGRREVRQGVRMLRAGSCPADRPPKATSE